MGNHPSPLKIVGAVVLAITLLIVGWSSWYLVGVDQRAVEYNRFTGTTDVADPGFNLKAPFPIAGRVKYDVTEQVIEADAASASRDLQSVYTTVTVRYHPDFMLLDEIHKTLGKGYADRVIKPAVQEAVKASTARYNADELISKRPIVKDNITSYLRERLADQHIVLDNVDITNFEFSESFNRAIEEKVEAEQQALKEHNLLKVAEARAQQKVVAAQAEADAARIISEQIAEQPGYVRYLWVQKWDGRMPTVVGGGDDLSLIMPEEYATRGKR